MTQYAIMVREMGSDHEIELCRVGSNPEEILKALRAKTRQAYNPDGKKSRIALYEYVDAKEVSA